MELEEKVGVKAQGPVCASQHVGGTPRGRGASRSSESGSGVRQWSGGHRNPLASRAMGGILGFTTGNQCSVLGRGGTGSILIGSLWYQCCLMGGRPGDHLEVIREIHCRKSDKR